MNRIVYVVFPGALGWGLRRCGPPIHSLVVEPCGVLSRVTRRIPEDFPSFVLHRPVCWSSNHAFPLWLVSRIHKTPCGFCFVEYENRAEAEDAMKYLNQMRLDDRVIRLDWCVGTGGL